MVIGQTISIIVIRHTFLLSDLPLFGVKDLPMKTKVMWGGAVITAFIVIGIWFYRQLRRALSSLSMALSTDFMQAFTI